VIPRGDRQAEACGLTNLAVKCVKEGSAITLFDVPIFWNWFVHNEQQEKQKSIFLQDASNVRWNYAMVWMGQYYPPELIVGEVRSTWFDRFVGTVAWCLRKRDGRRMTRKNISHVGGYLAHFCRAELFHRSGKAVENCIAMHTTRSCSTSGPITSACEDLTALDSANVSPRRKVTAQVDERNRSATSLKSRLRRCGVRMIPRRFGNSLRAFADRALNGNSMVQARPNSCLRIHCSGRRT
jgi:hypothetical protein